MQSYRGHSRLEVAQCSRALSVANAPSHRGVKMKHLFSLRHNDPRVQYVFWKQGPETCISFDKKKKKKEKGKKSKTRRTRFVVSFL